MIQTVSGALEKFHDEVGIKFQLYNSLFLSLPFYGIDKTGILLSLFNTECEDGYRDGRSPEEIVDGFFRTHSTAEELDFLFRFVQYTERQVVLFDALEDAAFSSLNDVRGAGTLTQLEARVQQEGKSDELAERLREFSVRLVLTAHPTQFYPGAVLGIINDLVDAVANNDVSLINTYLQQLGRTPFFKKQKPTPFDEAQSLIWYLENVFYEAIGAIAGDLRASVPGLAADLSGLVKMGFWSGGDRDGNPFVKTDTTVRTAEALRLAALKCYYRDTRKLKRRLTFTGVDSLLAELEDRLYADAFSKTSAPLTKDDILSYLGRIRAMLIERHNGLFLHLVDELIEKVETFGLHFASVDIRQDSSVHFKVLSDVAAKTDALPDDFNSLSEDAKIAALLGIGNAVDASVFDDDLTRDTLENIAAVKEIQARNGVHGCERYIISHSESTLNVIEVVGMFLLGGWSKESLTIDIVPLFETIADLKQASAIMRKLYETPEYRAHLARRGDTQTIMLGFSDGTKDGGYLMANWSIYKAKDELTALAREYGISVIFFDGRGGPPARGGGKTHKFYSSMGENIANDSIELTIQGQTVSSNFGTVAAAKFNIEQLLHAGIYNDIFASREQTFAPDEEKLLRELAERSLAAYEKLKNHPQFLDYLSDVSPLKFYAQTNIGSRPAKRGSGKMTLDDLRAIPFVGAWSQLKQNVPGFYGVGAALSDMSGQIDEIRKLYHSNLFFKTLLDNCEMAMQKSDFALTKFLENDATYGEVWRMIHDEYVLCREFMAKITGKKELMGDFPVEQQSVRTRERIVLPLTTIQQYALKKIRESNDEKLKESLGKLVVRCSFGIINAGRNSA